jgi:uncharacterized protein YcfJ
MALQFKAYLGINFDWSVKSTMKSIGKSSFVVVMASALLVLTTQGCSTRPSGGTLLGSATGAGIGAMVGSGKGQTGAMLGLGLLGALVGNQLFDEPANDREEEDRRRDDEDYEYRRRLRDDWRRDEYRDRDQGYYRDDRGSSRRSDRNDDYRY